MAKPNLGVAGEIVNFSLHKLYCEGFKTAVIVGSCPVGDLVIKEVIELDGLIIFSLLCIIENNVHLGSIGVAVVPLKFEGQYSVPYMYKLPMNTKVVRILRER